MHYCNADLSLLCWFITNSNRSPLVSIRLSSELLLEKCPPGSLAGGRWGQGNGRMAGVSWALDVVSSCHWWGHWCAQSWSNWCKVAQPADRRENSQPRRENFHSPFPLSRRTLGRMTIHLLLVLHVSIPILLLLLLYTQIHKYKRKNQLNEAKCRTLHGCGYIKRIVHLSAAWDRYCLLHILKIWFYYSCLVGSLVSSLTLWRMVYFCLSVGIWGTHCNSFVRWGKTSSLNIKKPIHLRWMQAREKLNKHDSKPVQDTP